MFSNPLGSLLVRLWAFAATLFLTVFLFTPTYYHLPNYWYVSGAFVSMFGIVVILTSVVAGIGDGQYRAEKKIAWKFHRAFHPCTSIQQVVMNELKKVAQEKKAIEGINRDRAVQLKREFEKLLKLAKKANLVPENLGYESFFA